MFMDPRVHTNLIPGEALFEAKEPNPALIPRRESSAQRPSSPKTKTETSNHKMSKSQTPRRLLIFQEARNPANTAEIVYLPVNKLGLPICGDGPDLPSILELPLRILKVFTDIFNQPKYKGWYVFVFSL